jgi:hypothetical protein
VTHLGITGHQSIPEAARDFVRQALKTEIERASLAGQLWGITGLAVGADQMFAELVLQADGRLYVIIPSAMYEATFDDEGLARYQTLLAVATKLERLKFE